MAHRPETNRRTNAAVLDGGLVEFVRDLKQQRGGDVGVHAIPSVAQALLGADLVDELRLVIAPLSPYSATIALFIRAARTPRST